MGVLRIETDPAPLGEGELLAVDREGLELADGYEVRDQAVLDVDHLPRLLRPVPVRVLPPVGADHLRLSGVGGAEGVNGDLGEVGVGVAAAVSHTSSTLTGFAVDHPPTIP
jgi:hypothetical protein